MSRSALANSTDTLSPQMQAKTGSWKCTHSAFGAVWLGTLLIAWFILRLILLCQFTAPAPFSQIIKAFLTGAVRDVLVGMWLTIPAFACSTFIPSKSPARWRRALFWSAALLFWSVQF